MSDEVIGNALRSLLVGENGLQSIEVVPGGERLKGLIRLAAPDVALEHFLESQFEILESHPGEDLTPDCLVRAEPPPTNTW